LCEFNDRRGQFSCLYVAENIDFLFWFDRSVTQWGADKYDPRAERQRGRIGAAGQSR
jgi:hypothetical protein